MIPEFTVTEITSVLQKLMHEVFHNIKIRGEISGVSRPNSGHVYFTLKDDNSVLNAVCWCGTKVKAQFTNGTEVLCTGYLSNYQSKYQLIVSEMELAGLGKLAAMLLDIKNRLESEGLFAASRKKRFPLLPLKIGVITSATGTVIRDIIDRVKYRFPSHILIWPVQVQGHSASSMIIDAISGFNTLPDKPDVIIVARGGGSIEDLWPFNDEMLARTVASSKIPIVSAIGHETDFTIIDYAADLRAPTPTAAVELILPEKHKLLESLAMSLLRMKNSIDNSIKAHLCKLLRLQNALTETRHKIAQYNRKLLEYNNRITTLLQIILLRHTQRLENLKHRLNHYDKHHILNVGYSIIYDNEGLQVSSSSSISPNDVVTIEWKDGKRRALILE